MNFKKIIKAILLPHLAVVISLLPISIALLVFSLLCYETTHVISIISYIFAFYMLVVICMRIPRMIDFIRSIKNNNKYISKYFSDVHYRMNISLYTALIWNVVFAVFQLGLGFYHNSVWFYAMCVYYIMLAIMRFFLVKHTNEFKANENICSEIKKSYLCGWLLLIMNLALMVIIFFIVYWNKSFDYGEIATITLALYTFVTFTFAIINAVKYKRYKSPIYSSAKAINLVVACVSMLTLENVMLNTFGGNEVAGFRQIMLGVSGGAVSICAIVVALYMIIKGYKNLKLLNVTQDTGV
ncbi:MAG: hypothetical protein E7361_00570 [Clostridiales bacterium]|nr:hypothetical protein [Clostridiales bacterium]